MLHYFWMTHTLHRYTHLTQGLHSVYSWTVLGSMSKLYFISLLMSFPYSCPSFVHSQRPPLIILDSCKSLHQAFAACIGIQPLCLHFPQLSTPGLGSLLATCLLTGIFVLSRPTDQVQMSWLTSGPGDRPCVQTQHHMAASLQQWQEYVWVAPGGCSLSLFLPLSTNNPPEISSHKTGSLRILCFIFDTILLQLVSTVI